MKDGGTEARYKLPVGEMWLKQGEEWKCRYYQATMLK
jgi:hypothetical protein